MKKLGKVGLRRQKGLAKLKPPESGRCENCHRYPDFRGLSRHHKKKRSQGGNEERSNIQYLCGVCDSKAHGIIEKDSKPQWSKDGY